MGDGKDIEGLLIGGLSWVLIIIGLIGMVYAIGIIIREVWK
jgi:hypothetical protein